MSGWPWALLLGGNSYAATQWWVEFLCCNPGPRTLNTTRQGLRDCSWAFKRQSPHACVQSGLAPAGTRTMQAEDLLTVTFCPLPSVSAMRHGSGFQCIEIISLLLACLHACMLACKGYGGRTPLARRPTVLRFASQQSLCFALCSGA